MKVLLLAVTLFAASNTISAQYYHSPDDSILSTANFDDGNVYNITQVHTSNDTLIFKYYKLTAILPVNWDVLLCDNTTCHPDLIDSSEMMAVPGDHGLMSLHVNPHFEAGMGIVRYLIYSTASPAQVDTLTWIISAGGTGLSSDPMQQTPQIIVSDNVLIIKNAGPEFDQLNVYDLSGRLVYGGDFEYGQHFYPLKYRANGFIIVKMNGKNLEYSQKIQIQ